MVKKWGTDTLLLYPYARLAINLYILLAFAVANQLRAGGERNFQELTVHASPKIRNLKVKNIFKGSGTSESSVLSNPEPAC